MDETGLLKSNQEQAVASWINYLNQVRLDRLMKALALEQEYLENATHTLRNTLQTVRDEIVFNGKGRGGDKGMHGFIAEVLESGVRNAREEIEGKAPIYEWIDDNGRDDLKRGAELIQLKFSASGGHLSLKAITQHIQAYPDFLKNGGKYQIPSDHYEKITWLLSIPESEANKMPTSTGEFSLSQWKEVHTFFEEGTVSLDKVEPSALDYSSVQRNTYEHTVAVEKDRLIERNQARRDTAYQDSKPTVLEGAKATAVSAAIEGVMALCQSIIAKKRSGKQLKEFDQDDWIDIAGDTGVGLVKGGVRGASIYALTNYTATPASVANAIVSAAFGIAEQAFLFRKGQLDQVSFIENCEMICLDVTVSAMSSFAGQILIPIPVLGAVIGNTVGTMMYQIGKDYLETKEQKILEDYLESISTLDEELKKQYSDYVTDFKEGMRIYMDILDSAFAPNISEAFDSSILLAKEMGVPSEEVLDSKMKIRAYFTE